MPQTAIEQTAPLDVPEEWRKFQEWAAESRSINPFVYLAMHWHAGHLTIEEGRRIEADRQIARFLKKK